MADTTTTPRRLAGIELFHGLPETELEAIEKMVRWRQVKAGEQILDRSSDNRDLFLVTDGSVRIVNFSRSGREVAYAVVNEGGFFGELAAIDGEARSATVVAIQKSQVATMSPSLFQDLMCKHPAMMMTVVRRLAKIVRTCDDRIMDLSTLGAVQRVYLELLRMSKPDAAGAGFWVIYPMPPHKEIAARASTTRETVARVLSQLTSDELIEKRDKVLYLQDTQRLQSMADVLASRQGQENAR
ncbi:MAG: Crp/Fnr family transcriptional regulator [Rhodospirillaceae bacterium]|nr:Crp/Fnr family transcriptional regulator [Rhodospirillaceae bacterium]MBT7614651.1 Crp/Fnr family transcriptional regulator [Rhodospirillaceae bacterium]MBT7647956.1 Crp/Fnr family transcriptional regulator [Rhodospirillaceae bacterium]